MKEAELRECTTCALCGQLIGVSGLPLFWRVTVERYGIDMHAVRRQDGLAAFMGSSHLAAVMGPDEDVARPMMEPVKLTLCEPCGMAETRVAVLSEAGREDNLE